VQVTPSPAQLPKPAAQAAKPVAPAPTPAAEPLKADSATPAAAAGRFVVQVGAFAEAAAVRDTRAKVEKLGLVTYTQVVETPGGARTRVRIGPFASRDEADKAAAKLKAAGLAGAVLAL
jgi:DedD protein